MLPELRNDVINIHFHPWNRKDYYFFFNFKIMWFFTDFLFHHSAFSILIFFHYYSKNNIFIKFLSIKFSLSSQKKLRHTISIVTRASLTPYSAISHLPPPKITHHDSGSERQIVRHSISNPTKESDGNFSRCNSIWTK